MNPQLRQRLPAFKSKIMQDIIAARRTGIIRSERNGYCQEEAKADARINSESFHTVLSFLLSLLGSSAARPCYHAACTEGNAKSFAAPSPAGYQPNPATSSNALGSA